MTRPSKTRVASILIAAAVTLGAWEPTAGAQQKTEKAAADVRARELFLKGDAAYAEGRYEEALAAFQEAYDLSGRPQLLFNISNSLERLGRYQEAVDALDKYLASGKAKDRDVVQKRLANLKKRVEDQKKEQEKLAREEDEKRQHEEAERKKREEAQGGAAQANGGPTDGAAAVPPEKPSGSIVPWVLIGGGGVVLVTGAVFGVLTLGARSDAKAGCADADAGHLCDADARSALDREKTFGLVADIGIVSGLVLGGIGTYFLLTEKPAEPKVKVGIRSLPGGGGVQVGGTF
jgi:tetratricopeptide (TPR) repeat protein